MIPDLRQISVEELSKQVEETNLTDRAREERRYNEAVQRLATKTAQEIAAITPVAKQPPHDFIPYGNPNVYPGCVRCGYPRKHEVHGDQE